MAAKQKLLKPIHPGEIRRSKRRTIAIDKEYAKALVGTLTEWLSKKDEKAYREL